MIFRTKSPSVIRIILILMAWLTDKVVAFEVQKIPEKLLRNEYIHNVSLCGAGFWLVAPSEHSLSKMRLVREWQDSVSYRDVIIHFFVSNLQDMFLDDMCFQLDCATCHTAQETIQLLHESSACVISHFNEQNSLKQEMSPRSCDLTPLDFFLWGFMPTSPRSPTEIGNWINDIYAHRSCKISKKE